MYIYCYIYNIILDYNVLLLCNYLNVAMYLYMCDQYVYGEQKVCRVFILMHLYSVA